MAEHKVRTREENPNWRGGRLKTTDGYVIIRVGIEHHLADVRGYAYEHRLVAEKKLGRRLNPGEVVHHSNGIKDDNSAGNIQVFPSNAFHLSKHRKRSDLKDPGEPNPAAFCGCGCGGSFLKYDAQNRPRHYLPGHNNRTSR